MGKQQKKYLSAKKAVESIIEFKYLDFEGFKFNYKQYHSEQKNLLRHVSPEEYKSLKQS